MSVSLPTPAQLDIAHGVAAFLAGDFPLARLRDNGGQDLARWPGLAAIGMLGISLPEAEGGLGLAWVDEILALREAGRQLVSPALIGSVLGAHIAARNGLVALRDAVLRGERSVGVVLPSTAPGITAVDSNAGLALRVEAQRLSLLDLTGCAAAAPDCIDESVQLAMIDAPPQPLASVEDAELALAAPLLAAAMLCGVLEQALAMASEHARTRVQFGRPIGAFQAVKHRCADMALAAELCWSQTLQAAQALDRAAPDRDFHVHAALLLAGDEALASSRGNIQVHGAMGITDEVDAHRLLKRAHLLSQLFGEPRRLAAALIDLPLEV